ncbi:hypothetical protein [Amycolatopsis sp. La24]|uniref:hypothetical protein n=1 Tax=Amycolatopsis sp. La24 TaxID=3028304 RepID=UPI0023B10ED0|nr:hypothetical protein [Amycolatopsis sp. La24]
MTDSPRNYPLEHPESSGNDARFTFGLVLDVAEVLTRHGYPPLADSGLDHVDLQQALFRFLYGPAE